MEAAGPSFRQNVVQTVLFMTSNAFSRRDFLNITAGGFAAAAVTGLSGCAKTESPATVASISTNIPIGVQLFCFRHLLEKDVPGTLAEVAKLGFVEVEFAGHYGSSAQETKKMLDDNGLDAVSTHLSIGDLLGDEFEKTVAYNQIIGNNNLFLWGIGEDRRSKDALMRTIDDFVMIADKLRPLGMKTGYHCHDYSFSMEYDGKNIWDWIADNTPEDFVMQLDTGNARSGGADLAAALKNHPGRIKSMHIKPYTVGADNPSDPFIGDDSTDWAQIIELSESIGGIESYIIEYEQESHPPLDALKDNLARFKRVTRS